MQQANANRNPEWDAVLGADTITGTARLLGVIVLFIIIVGSVFHLII